MTDRQTDNLGKNNMSPNPKGGGGWGRLNDPKIGRVSFYCRVMIPKDATELQTVRP